MIHNVTAEYAKTNKLDTKGRLYKNGKLIICIYGGYGEYILKYQKITYKASGNTSLQFNDEEEPTVKIYVPKPIEYKEFFVEYWKPASNTINPASSFKLTKFILLPNGIEEESSWSNRCGFKLYEEAYSALLEIVESNWERIELTANADDCCKVHKLSAVELVSKRRMDLIKQGKLCPYCNCESELIDSKEIYGRSYGMAYRCPSCSAYVGCHNGTTNALGRLANKELRDCKQKAHAVFDPLWKAKIKKDGCSKHEARKAGYAWLAKELNIDIEDCHIGMFNVQQCQKVYELCLPYYKRLDYEA